MNRIKELRTEIKMNQKEFAKIFGIAQNTLSQYETGKREPDTGLLLKMSDYFHVTIDYLLGNSNIRNFETNLDNQKTLSPRLKELRTEKGVSQQTIADYLGITRQSYSNYELGNREADYVTLTKLANYFETTVDYLIGNSDIRNPEIVSSADDDLIVLMSRGGDKKVIKLTPEKKEKVKKAFELVFDDDEDIDF